MTIIRHEVKAGDEVRIADEGTFAIVRDHDSGRFILSPLDVCEACGEGGCDYETAGHRLCPGCVMSALRVRAVTHLLAEVVPNLDTSTARTLSILDEEDANMRASHTPYVDSLSASFDEVDGMDMRDVLDLLTPIVSHAFDHRHVRL
jgi:hypothetical protein